MNRYENLFKNLTKEQIYRTYEKLSVAVEDKHRQELFRAYQAALQKA